MKNRDGLRYAVQSSVSLVALLVTVVGIATPALAANRWKPVHVPVAQNHAPILLARLQVQGRTHALYRDSKTQGYVFSVKGRRDSLDEHTARAFRSEVANLAWKIQYQAKLSKRPSGVCRVSAAEVAVPATDDLVRICAAEQNYLREARALSLKFERIINRKVARR